MKRESVCDPTFKQSLGTSPQCALVFGFHVSAHCGPGSIHDYEPVLAVTFSPLSVMVLRSWPGENDSISWIYVLNSLSHGVPNS